MTINKWIIIRKCIKWYKYMYAIYIEWVHEYFFFNKNTIIMNILKNAYHFLRLHADNLYELINNCFSYCWIRNKTIFNKIILCTCLLVKFPVQIIYFQISIRVSTRPPYFVQSNNNYNNHHIYTFQKTQWFNFNSIYIW